MGLYSSIRFNMQPAAGQTLAKHRSITGQSPAKHRPITSQSRANHRSNTGQTPVNHRLNTGQSPVKHRPNSGQPVNRQKQKKRAGHFSLQSCENNSSLFPLSNELCSLLRIYSAKNFHRSQWLLNRHLRGQTVFVLVVSIAL